MSPFCTFLGGLSEVPIDVHAFGRFFKVGVEGQQWQMPPDCELKMGVFAYPAERVNSDHIALAASVPMRISANSRRISSTLTVPLAVYGTQASV